LDWALLAGCTGVNGEKYLGMPGSPAWFATASPQTIAAHFADQCAAYGFQPGTTAMAQCIRQEAASKRQSNAIRSAAVNAQIAASQPKHTTCSGFGNMVNCTTY
jgi:hypothetical protein